MSNTITVTACDNELIVLAYQGDASFELCQILSGNNQPVNVTLDIAAGAYQNTAILNGVNQPLGQTISQSLPAGSYSLLMLGVNWGGPTQFTVNVNGTTYNQLTQQGAGLTFNPGPVSITV